MTIHRQRYHFLSLLGIVTIFGNTYDIHTRVRRNYSKQTIFKSVETIQKLPKYYAFDHRDGIPRSNVYGRNLKEFTIFHVRICSIETRRVPWFTTEIEKPK